MSDLSRMPAPCEPTGKYLFASYAHTDRDAVYPILERFLGLGARIWYDAGINLSSDWTDSIGDAIKGCSAFVVFITPRSVASKNVKNEIAFAAETDRQILAIHLEETKLPAGIALTLNLRQALLEWQKPKDVIYRELTDFVSQHLAETPSSTLRDIRLRFQSTVKELVHDRGHQMALSPDGTSVVVMGPNSGTGPTYSTVVNTCTGAEELEINNATHGRPMTLGGPEGNLLATSSNWTDTHYSRKGPPVLAEHKSILRLLHLPDLAETCRLSHDHFLYDVAFSSDGALVALGLGNFSAEKFPQNKSLTFALIVRADTGAEVHRIPLAFNPRALAFSPDSTLLALSSARGDLSIVQTDTGREKYRLTDPAIHAPISFNPDGTLLALGEKNESLLVPGRKHESHNLSVLQTRTGEWAYRINVLSEQVDASKEEASGWPVGLAFSPDGALFTTWGTTYIKPPTRVPNPKRPNKQMRNPDRTLKQIQTASVFQARTGVLLYQFNDEHGSWGGLPTSFSPDSSLLAVAAKDSIRVCDAQTGKTICRLGYGEGMVGKPAAISFSHDGSLLVAVGDIQKGVGHLAGQPENPGFVIGAELIHARS